MKRLSFEAEQIRSPKNYFDGVRCEWHCETDNILFFLRRSRSELQHKTFASKPHSRFVLILNLQTPGIVSVDRNYLSLSPGQALLIQPFQFHHYLNIAAEKLHWLFITFETGTPEALEEFRFQVLSLDDDATARISRLIHLYRSRQSALRSNLVGVELQGLLIVLRNRLVRQLASQPLFKSNRQSVRSMKLLKGIHLCLSQSARHAHTIPYIARQLALSESRLRFIFRQQFGFSLGAYIRHYQTHQALSLMQNPAKSLKDIAMAAGYTALSTFSRAFKLQTGVSPAKFRKKYFV